jgi:hypothetical protein
MSEQKDKTPEQVSDEDYKVAPTSADEQYLKKAGGKKAKATGENYQLPDEKVKE